MAPDSVCDMVLILCWFQVEYLVQSSTSRGKENTTHAASGTWIREDEIKDRKRITEYNESLIQHRRIKSIIGAAPATSKNGECIWFYVQWVDDKPSGAWLPAQVLKTNFPQDLIKFYESHLTIF